MGTTIKDHISALSWNFHFPLFHVATCYDLWCFPIGQCPYYLYWNFINDLLKQFINWISCNHVITLITHKWLDTFVGETRLKPKIKKKIKKQKKNKECIVWTIAIFQILYGSLRHFYSLCPLWICECNFLRIKHGFFLERKRKVGFFFFFFFPCNTVVPWC